MTNSAYFFNLTIIVHCPQPNVGLNVIVENYSGGFEGSETNYSCQSGFIPREIMTSTCNHNGDWTPDPANLYCEGNTLQKIKRTNLCYNIIV